MPLPYSFILGLFCVFASWDLLASLPREASLASVLAFSPLCLLPWIVIRVLAARDARRRNRRGGRGSLSRALTQLSVPLAYYVLLTEGRLGEWADQASGSLTLSTLIKLVPLLGMEALVHLGQRQTELRLRSVGLVGGPPPFHLTLVMFLSVLVLFFTVGVDVLSLNRGMEVFFASTALGNAIWLLGFLIVLCAALPFVFRMLAPSSMDVPEDSRRTASALGFPSDNVQLLRTDNRLVNAMLVGPVPGFRFLFLTDGLVALLDPVSLRGVVGHEVGHAKANHPMLLMVVFGLIPFMLFYPLDVLGLGTVEPWTLTAIGLVAILAGILVLRRIAHRFELEADLLSADALGSAPCILALHKVSELAGGARSRDTLRHPSEDKRIHHLLSCDGDPWFRERFERRGTRLRRSVAVAVVLAAVVSVWAHTRLWPVDKLILQFYTGQFAAAQTTLVELPATLPPGRQGLVEELRQELDAARSLRPDGGDWSSIREGLAARALATGRQELLRNGPKAARAWFSLAMSKSEPTPMELSLYLYCRAVARADAARVAELREHLLAEFDLGEDLERAIRHRPE